MTRKAASSTGHFLATPDRPPDTRAHRAERHRGAHVGASAFDEATARALRLDRRPSLRVWLVFAWLALVLVVSGCSALGGGAQVPAHEGRETTRDFLVSGQAEGESYGLYSYLLLGSPATAKSRERYLLIITEYLKIAPREQAEEYIPRPQLNITYLPLTERAPPNTSAEWILDHYDYARARQLLGAVAGEHALGPYIVSSLKPLTSIDTLSGKYLFQDMSTAHPDLAAMWMSQYLEQSSKERFWQVSELPQWRLELINLLKRVTSQRVDELIVVKG